MAAPSSETPVLDLLASMTADSVAASSLDPQTLMLVRIAALAAVDAPPVSYLMNLGAAAEVGVDADQVRGVLAAIAPIVGTARVASATAASSRRSRSRSRSRSSTHSARAEPDRPPPALGLAASVGRLRWRRAARRSRGRPASVFCSRYFSATEVNRATSTPKPVRM